MARPAPARDELPPPPDDRFVGEAPRTPPPARPQPPPVRPQPAPQPVRSDDELPPPDLGSLGLKPASAVARPAPRPVAPPEERPREPSRPLAARPNGAPVERVREPERDLADPGGEGDDFDDPFADEDAPPPPPARPAARRPAPRSDGPDRLL